MNERLDALLSARCDGVLEAAEAAELDRLLEASDAARRRALDFERIDEQLRSLAANSAAGGVADARLARSLAVLRQRSELALAHGRRDRGARGVARRGRVLGWGIAAAVAAIAAGWIVSVVSSPRGEESESGRSVEMQAGIAESGGDEVASEDLAALGIDQPGDLEVIEELELLEFLADQERSAEGPRG